MAGTNPRTVVLRPPRPTTPDSYAPENPKHEDVPTTKLQGRNLEPPSWWDFPIPTAKPGQGWVNAPSSNPSFPKILQWTNPHQTHDHTPNPKLCRKSMRDITHERARARTLHTRLHQSLTIYKLPPISNTETCRHHTA